MKSLLNIFAGFSAGILFAYLYNALDFSFLLAIFLTIVYYYFFIKIIDKKPKKEDFIKIDIHGLTQQEFDDIFNEGLKKLNNLKNLKEQIYESKINEKLGKIIIIAEKIFEDFQKDPKDIKKAKQFLNYYLDTTIVILSKYKDLTISGLNISEINDYKAKIETLLDKIEIAFEKQLNYLLKDDILDLDTEIEVFEKTLKLEGFGEKANDK